MQIGSSSGGTAWSSQATALPAPQMRERAETGPENDQDSDDRKAAAVTAASGQALAASGRGQRVNLMD